MTPQQHQVQLLNALSSQTPELWAIASRLKAMSEEASSSTLKLALDNLATQLERSADKLAEARRQNGG